MSGDENNSSHQICIVSLGTAAMVPAGSRAGARHRQSTQAAPGHAGQEASPGEWLWVPQMGATSFRLAGAAVALLRRELGV